MKSRCMSCNQIIESVVGIPLMALQYFDNLGDLTNTMHFCDECSKRVNVKEWRIDNEQ
jgi:hypothetical protein